MDTLEKKSVLERIDCDTEQIENVVMSLGLLTISGIVFANVIARYFFQTAFAWSEELARYVVAHGFYARYTKLLRTLPKKKRARLRELRARLAAEEGRAVAAGEEIDDEDVALELERSLALLQDKYFTQCEATARALGLNITSRCKLVIPQEPPVPKSNKFDRFKKLAEGE